jgi:hypothetical protein
MLTRCRLKMSANPSGYEMAPKAVINSVLLLDLQNTPIRRRGEALNAVVASLTWQAFPAHFEVHTDASQVRNPIRHAIPAHAFPISIYNYHQQGIVSITNASFDSVAKRPGL